jgi:hypothetical protein
MPRFPDARPTPWVRARRAVLLTFMVGLVATGAAFFATIAQHAPGPVSSTVSTSLGPVTFFESVRTVDADGSSATLTPGFGVAVLLIALPLLVGALTYTSQRSARGPAEAAAT